MRMPNKVCKVSLNFTWQGKPVKNTDGMYFEGKKVYLGYGWKNIEIEYPDLHELLCLDGIAVGPYLNQNDGKQGHRISENFESHSVVLVDIDSGLTIEQATNDPFYKNYGSGYYTTASHDEVNHRFRLIFVLQDDITSPVDMRHLYNWMITHFGGDAACKDEARLFYGSIDAADYTITEAVLPTAVVKELIAEQKASEEKKFVAAATVECKPLDDAHKNKLRDLLYKTFVGDYAVWRNVGFAMYHSGFSLEDFQFVTRGMMRLKSDSDAKTIWNSADKYNQVSIGSLIWLVKNRWGADCLGNNKQAVLTGLMAKLKSK